jgi:hypothetical protein
LTFDDDCVVGHKFLLGHVITVEEKGIAVMAALTTRVLGCDSLNVVRRSIGPCGSAVKVRQQIITIEGKAIARDGHVAYRYVLPRPILALDGVTTN